MATKAPAPSGTRLTIRLPDDFHHHSRDGPKTAAVLIHATKRFGRCLMMPNLKPPVTTTALALSYRDHIQASMPKDKDYPHFQPLMTLYLTDKTTAEEIRLAAEAGIVGCKYYPAGATTNSDHGVTDIRNCHGALKEMAERGMMLAIHSEVTHADIFEREPVFIEEVIKPLVAAFPTLKITMEHISTKEAVDYVLSAPDNVKASITCHHLLYNRNRKFDRTTYFGIVRFRGDPDTRISCAFFTKQTCLLAESALIFTAYRYAPIQTHRVRLFGRHVCLTEPLSPLDSQSRNSPCIPVGGSRIWKFQILSWN